MMDPVMALLERPASSPDAAADSPLFVLLKRCKQRPTELVAACVVRKPGRDLSADDLIAHCRRFLASYKIPRHIEFSETELPKSGSGKSMKRLLRERFWVGQKRDVA
jgi:acyl-CoA synthetase (AMP-forming)/AMP-acid ligase II